MMEKRVSPSTVNLFVILALTILAISPLFPLRVTPASAPSDKFSGERALSHLSTIAKAPHPSGSPAQQQVRDYLVQQLQDLNLEVEVQKAPGVENVVARLRGIESSGAVLIQAHYDSIKGPGAADNGAGVAALLEIMRALASSPKPRNDIIALFDDGEEMPDAFTGTKAFIRSHPWMKDVRVAIGMDTAARGFVSVDDTGSENGWMVNVLARVYTDAAWTSLGGGGNYDTQPFRDAGIQVLELEDNYPFHEQHTMQDVPGIVRPGTLQQLGDGALAVAREISMRDLADTSGVQQTFMYIWYIGLLHYPQTWVLPLAVLAGILLFAAFAFALWQKSVTWAGLGIAFLAALLTAGLAAVSANAIWKAAPGLFGWKTHLWSEWPEVIPPNGWIILIVLYLFVLALTVFVYRLARRWIAGASFSFFGLFVLLLFSVVLAVTAPAGAIITTWPVMIGAAAWMIALAIRRKGINVSPELIALVVAVPTILYILPLLLAVFMGDGTKSVAITTGVWVFIVALALPGVDRLIAQPENRLKEPAKVG